MANPRKLTIKIKKLVEDNKFKIEFGEKFLSRKIEAEMIDRPGVEFCGNFDYFDNQRIIIVGVKESVLLASYSKEKQEEIIHQVLKHNPPAILFSGNKEAKKIIPLFKKIAKNYEIPLLSSVLKTTPLMGLLYYYLHSHLSEPLSVHGVLVDIYGVGTLVIGDSGVGKSETALELIRKGHLLVSDDLVEIRETKMGSLNGTAPQILRRYLEIRGIGIVDVVTMFGSGAYREKKRIQLVVELEKYDPNKNYDRLGLTEQYEKYFNTKVHKITIPVKQGRNIATLVESAATNFKLKSLGYNAAYIFTESVAKKARGEDIDDD